MLELLFKIDAREHKIIEEINARYSTLKYTASNLDIGDIQIDYINKDITYTFIIERKTITDCLASIKDNRYKEQKLRCKSYISSTPNTLFFYILEGQLYKDTKTSKERQMIHGFLISNNLRDNVNVFNSGSVKETVDLLIRLSDRLKKDYKELFKHDKEKLSLNNNSNSTSRSNINNVLLKTKEQITVNKLEHSESIQLKEISNCKSSSNTYILENDNLMLEYKVNPDSIKIINISTKKQTQEELFINNSVASNISSSINTSNISSPLLNSIKQIIIDVNKSKELNTKLETEYLESRISKKKKDNMTPKLSQQLMLTNIPGISSKYATELLNNYSSINKLICFINDKEKTKEEIFIELKNKKITTSTGKERCLGSVLSSRIIEYLS